MSTSIFASAHFPYSPIHFTALIRAACIPALRSIVRHRPLHPVRFELNEFTDLQFGEPPVNITSKQTVVIANDRLDFKLCELF